MGLFSIFRNDFKVPSRKEQLQYWVIEVNSQIEDIEFQRECDKKLNTYHSRETFKLQIDHARMFLSRIIDIIYDYPALKTTVVRMPDVDCPKSEVPLSAWLQYVRMYFSNL